MDEQINKKVIDISSLAYDLNTIADFVFQDKNKDKTNEIKEVYEIKQDGSLILKEKILTESKTEEGNSMASIRYDMVRHLMDKADSILMNDFDVDIDNIEDEENNMTTPLLSSLGDTFAINTLLKEGMLVNVDFNEINKEDGE